MANVIFPELPDIDNDDRWWDGERNYRHEPGSRKIQLAPILVN